MKESRYKLKGHLNDQSFATVVITLEAVVRPAVAVVCNYLSSVNLVVQVDMILAKGKEKMRFSIIIVSEYLENYSTAVGIGLLEDTLLQCNQQFFQEAR